MIAKEHAETYYKGCKAVYGDSVLGDTPLLLLNKETNNIEIKQIDDIYEEWKPYDLFKPNESNRKNKEQSLVSKYKIYTSNGWSDINRVIRHQTKKDIYRVNTDTGIVDVTEDHSLLDINSKIIKPKDLNIGTKLLHNYPNFDTKIKKLTEIDNYIDEIDNQSLKEKEAYIFGTNYIDGSNDEYKIVPISILNADHDIRYAFFAGYYYAYKRRYCLNEEIEKCIKFSNKSKIATSVLFYIIKSLDLYVNLDTCLDKFILTCYDKEINNDINNSINNSKGEDMDKVEDMDKEVKKCDLIHKSYTDYVYDIETKTGNFNSGFINC